jgi:hypothetical protein
MNWGIKPKKVSNVRQSYWKAKKVPIFKQRNDDSRLGEKEIKEKYFKGGKNEGGETYKEAKERMDFGHDYDKKIKRHESGYAD